MKTQHSNYEFEITRAFLTTCVHGHFIVVFEVDYKGNKRTFQRTDTDTQFYDESPCEQDIICRYFYRIEEQVEDYIYEINNY